MSLLLKEKINDGKHTTGTVHHPNAADEAAGHRDSVLCWGDGWGGQVAHAPNWPPTTVVKARIQQTTFLPMILRGDTVSLNSTGTPGGQRDEQWRGTD